jgi:hypothetical protein
VLADEIPLLSLRPLPKPFSWALNDAPLGPMGTGGSSNFLRVDHDHEDFSNV